MQIGRVQCIDGGPPGRVAPVEHIAEPIGEVRQRVENACRSDAESEFACWLVDTLAGDEVARLGESRSRFGSRPLLTRGSRAGAGTEPGEQAIVMDRRAFLRAGVAGGAVLLGARPLLGERAQAQAAGPFVHGVASGDPLPDRVVLWTRVTVQPDATPGSGRGGPEPVTWEVARDDGFRDLVAAGEVVTTAARDHTVKVDAAGLPPATELWYRFRALGATSPAGRTRTAPTEDSEIDSLRIGVVSCSNYPAGFFSAYRHLAQRDDLDFVLHLGDYLYEGGSSNTELGRLVDPPEEIVTLEHYRRRHALHKADPDLAALHRRYAFVTTIDDHEVANNSWAEGAGNHDASEGDYRARRSAAMQAYFEWMPIRPTGGAEASRIYRALRFGRLAELSLLDVRTYRSQAIEGLYGETFVADPAVGDPSRTMLGPAQRLWLEQRLDASTAQWNVIGNPVMFAPLVFGDPPDTAGVGDALQQVLAAGGLTLPAILNSDQWDGYRAEQAALRDRFGQVGGVVILTGDIHSSWACEIPADPGSYRQAVGGVSNAVEFVTPAVTSSSFSAVVADIGLPGSELVATQLPLIASTAGPWIKYLDAERHGFGIFEVNRDGAQYDWHHLSDRTDPQATEAVGASWRSPAGSNRLERSTPLGRRARGAGAPAPAPPPAQPGPAAPPGTGRRRLPATGDRIDTAAAAAAGAAAVAAGALVRRAGQGEATR